MRSSTARAWFALSLVALTSIAPGCGGGAVPKQSRTARPKTTLRADPNPKPQAALPGPALLPSYVLARLDDENAAPYVARRGEQMLLFYDAGGRLFTRLCNADGKPRTAEPIDVGPAAAEMPVATVEAVGDGYLAAWVEGMKSNAAVKVLSLDATGAARGAPITIAQSADEVSWVEIVAGPSSALVVWEVPREDHFDVLAAPVTPGKTPSPAVVLAHDALGWDLVTTERGAAIATVVAATGAQDEAEQGRIGRVLYADVDFTGKVSAPVVVNPEATAQNDIVVARAGKRALIGWTDVRNIDSSVYVAAVEPGGTIVTPPKRATTPVGEQALVSLVSGAGAGKRALLAWEDLLRSPREGRLIHLATMDPDGKLGAERATLVFSASGPPDITADGDGFAALTLAPTTSAEGPLPKDAPIWPIFVRFGPDMNVRASEPVRAEPFASTEGIPYLTRSLSCQAGACTTLAASGGSPATLAAVALPVRQSPWRAPASRDPDEVPPRPLGVTALYDGEHLARVAAAERPSGGSLAAWVTYHIEGNSDVGRRPARKDEPLATVGVRAVSAAGVPGKTQILSRRGLSIGGVAIASAPGGKVEESALVWAARDKNDAQVQIAKLGPEGDKLAQKPLTTITRKPNKDGVPSEVSDVAVAYAPPSEPGKSTDDGFIVAWVDTRDGNAEVYAARVDRTLRKVVQDRRITEAIGDSAEVQIVVRGKETLLVWSDARSNPEDGSGDIHVVRLDTRTLQKVGPETRIFASPAHSRSPSVALAGDRVVVAWIEEAAPDAKPEASEAGVRIAVIDERGANVGTPRLVRGEEQSAVTSVAVTCAASKCRGVLTSALRESMLLDAFEFAPGAPPGPLKALAALTGGANADVSPSFAGREGTSLFFGDDAVGGTGRVRFMTIGWP
ncbi:hypothetical protein [Polyangium spumosum]|uniref:DUF3616 domain-containing protein n=1 Tax=Polyangium spumosum TaxID=889282 RepID=A0A6N7PR52_9BACT|nr:hypothetical protein [Polyangium spumosum]MRG92840.1 hypothetical protein [Polyangium spumosum]